MLKWIAPGLGGAAAVALLAALWQAGGGPSQTGPAASAEAPRQQDWGSPDGGAVVLKANGTYSVLLDDASDNKSIFSEGRVVSHHPSADGGVVYVLKPTTPGQSAWSLEVIVKPDGSAELWLAKPGAPRHLAAPLKK